MYPPKSREEIEEIIAIYGSVLVKHEQQRQAHEIEHVMFEKEILDRLSVLECAVSMEARFRSVEFLPPREEMGLDYVLALSELEVAIQNTLVSFDDRGQRLDCFCKVQEKARALFKAVDHFNQRKDARKQIALYIRDAVLNVYAEDLEKKNLESLLSVLDIARKEKLNSSDRRQVVRLLYKGGWHPYPNLKKGLSEVIAENE